jgi:predicted metal-dependent hydrolase
MNLHTMSDSDLQGVIRDEGMAARRHSTIEDIVQPEALVESAKDLLAARYQCGKVGRDGLPDQG